MDDYNLNLLVRKWTQKHFQRGCVSVRWDDEGIYVVDANRDIVRFRYNEISKALEYRYGNSEVWHRAL